MDASNVQTDFRGGEWSQTAQGRMDDKEYTRALNKCFNSFPIEEGAWTRRPGTRWIAYTQNGAQAWLFQFNFAQNAPYTMEFTNAALRFFAGPQLVFTSDVQQVSSVSAANPAVVTTQGNHGWTSNDIVQFILPKNAKTIGASLIAAQQYQITVLSSTTFSIAVPVSGVGIDGSQFTVPFGTSVGRALVVTSPYTDQQLDAVRHVQAEILNSNTLQGVVVTLHNAVAPQQVVNSVPESNGAFAQFTMGAITFKDGPYFDPPTNGVTITPSALTGAITLTATGNTFVSTDVGRMVRLFSEPAAWAVGTAYVTGSHVKYIDGNYYTCISANTGQAPNTHPTLWSIDPAAAAWAWGTIATVTSATVASLNLDAGQPLLYTTAISTWRLGLYSATTGYPTNGVFHEGRLWLAGAQDNRFDGSNSDSPFNFAPTAVDGTVADSNAISYTFNSKDVNPILWMEPDNPGILCGTAGGEWLIQASALGDPLTPTSIQAHRVSKNKCANVPPVRAGFGLLFVQLAQKRLLEVTAEFYSGKFLARNVTEKARHLTKPGIARLAFQQDLCPIVWALMKDGSLAGMTYKRESSFSSEPPTFAGWHSHALGSGCLVESISTGPSMDGTLETLTLSVLDPLTGFRHIEMMADMFDETNNISQAWFVDGGMAPSSIHYDTTVTPNTLQLGGFGSYIGRTLTVWLAGIDAGDFLVAADGSITVPLTAALTAAYIATFVNAANTPYDIQVSQAVTVSTYAASASIQSYINTSLVTDSTDGTALALDLARDRIVTTTGSSGVTDGLKVYKASTGAYLGGITAPTLIATGKRIRNYQPGSNVVNGPMCIDNNGYLYLVTGTGNQCTIAKVDISNPASIFIQDLFGIAASGFTSTATKVPTPATMYAFKANDQDYLALSGSVANTGVTVLQTNSQQKLPGNPGFMINCTPNGAFLPAESGVQCCIGLETQNGKASIGHFYIIGHVNSDASSTAAINLYKCDLPAQNSRGQLPTPTFSAAIGAGILPANVDAAWTHFSVVRGPVYDKTDGHVIIWVQTPDAVANTLYVVKLNTTTGSIVWKTAITGRPNDIGVLGFTNIQYGQLQWMAGATLFTCTTSSGAVTTQAITNTLETRAQCSNDVEGALYVKATYTTGGGAPIPLNGTTSFTSEWCRLTGTGAGRATADQTFNTPVLPACVGFTYTSQGQRLRPVSQDQSGARNGPGFAKTRRNHKAGWMLTNSQAISIGTQFVDLTKMRPLRLSNDSVNVLALTSLFTGIVRQDVDDTNSFDGMLAWQITRPYPCTLSAVGGFLDTVDI